MIEHLCSAKVSSFESFWIWIKTDPLIRGKYQSEGCLCQMLRKSSVELTRG